MRVHPDFQWRGYGMQLLTAPEERAKQIGYKAIELDTTDQMIVAQRLYLNAGYAVYKQDRKSQFEMIFMRKDV